MATALNPCTTIYDDLEHIAVDLGNVMIDMACIIKRLDNVSIAIKKRPDEYRMDFIKSTAEYVRWLENANKTIEIVQGRIDPEI